MRKVAEFDNNGTIGKAVSLIQQGPVSLESLLFINDVPRKNVITTLPSSFNQGDFRFWVYSTVSQGKRAGLNMPQILKKGDFLKKAAKRGYKGNTKYARNLMYTYYNENIPRSVSSVDVATKRGIIPFGYNNPKIRYLNALFALAFWTGNISQGLVNTKPCDTNEGIVKDVLDKLGYKKREDNSGKRGLASTDPKKEDGKYAIPKPQNYQLCCSAASRSFGILGLPYREGRKASNKDFRIPWYALFMSGLLEEGQKFDDRSVGYSQEFQKIFIYALLSDKTNVGGDTVLVNLMGSHSENIGKGLTGTTSRILMNVFPGVQISEDNQITTEQVFKGRDDYNFRNTIYIEDKNWMPFIDTLEKDSGQSFDPKEPSYMEVRRLSGIALRGLVFKKD